MDCLYKKGVFQTDRNKNVGGIVLHSRENISTKVLSSDKLNQWKFLCRNQLPLVKYWYNLYWSDIFGHRNKNKQVRMT